MAKHATVDAYIRDLDSDRAAIVSALRSVVLAAAPEAKESIKWAHPTYEKGGPFCYIKAFPRYVNLGFWRGAALDDPAGIVRSGGEKMGHVRIETIADIRTSVLSKLVRQAVSLNAQRGDPSRTR
jgi:hypothetical protein